MIKSISIQNFQSHKKSELQFEPGVNIIIGSSDCGKTAIIRALNWLINNRPLGNAFRSVWGGDTLVDVEGDFGQVSRFRSDKENSYIIGMHDELKAFDKEVPDEIKQLLRFTDINLQKQLDAPFLLCETPGEVQRILNRIAHLDTIDITMKNIECAKRKISNELDSIVMQIKETKESLLKYSGIDQINDEIKNLIVRKTNVEKEKESLPILKRLIQKVTQNKNEIQELNTIISFEKKVSHILNLIEDYNELIETKDDLYDCLKSIKIKGLQIKKLKDICNYESSVAYLIEKIKERKDLYAKKIRLNVWTVGIRKCMEKIIEIKQAILEMENQFQMMFPNICPLCGKEKQ